ncbi:SDR family oxidoreductase [Halobacteria archaeon AArc-m2/3/4]|uniref:SDR family oxidoreductase n=1 Tax=Natronoglomus mannanivorans TaxID=2979990 RepID=A0ABT2QGV2_9EURY|nr:SDR family oxidoreductase [Halobacteria archaeon AArc-m2/3/4]
MDLTDRVAVVTGASSGIGEATARALAREGCAVVLAARREDRLERIASEIESELGLGEEDGDGEEEKRTLVVPTDVADEDDVASLIERTQEVFGRIDILVNNAGILRSDPVADADRADLQKQVQVNLLGTMNTTHAALPAVLESGGGDIVAVSSMNVRYPAEKGSAYTASKCGVNGFCRSLRKEMSDEDVRVTIVMPGPVASEMNDWEQWDGRPLNPADVAEAIVFAVSRPAHVELPEITVNTTDKLG